MRLASHGMRQGDGLKYNEIFLPILRNGMYEYNSEKSTLAVCIFILTVPRRYFCGGSLPFLLSVFILWFSHYVSDIFVNFR